MVLACLSAAVFVTSAQAQDPSMHPVVDARTGYLLGGSTMGEWMPPDATAAAVEAGAVYRLYSDGGAVGTGLGGRVESTLDICPETSLVPIDVPAAIQGRVIAIGGDWNALPRKPRFEKSAQPVYRKAMSEWLTARGIADPVMDSVQVVRIDLEGDGTDEVVLAASHRLPRQENAVDPRGLPGEYSVVLLRRVRDGKVETLELVEDVHAAASEDIPSHFDVAFILDLNGDGIMEIGITATYYEGDEIDVFTVEQGDPELILQAGCGA